MTHKHLFRALIYPYLSLDPQALIIIISDYPCSHPGPCDGRADCACFHNKAHCEVACRCDLSCTFPTLLSIPSYNEITTGPRRRRGCHCKKDVTGKLCYSARCPYYRAHRECDPVLCVDCDARYVFSSPSYAVNVIDLIHVRCGGIPVRKPPVSKLTRLA